MRRDYGSGSKYFDQKRQRYVYEYRYVDSSGHHKRKRIVSRSRKELKRKIQQWQESQKQLKLHAAITVRELVKIWLGVIQTSIKPNTYRQYVNVIQNYVLPQYGDVLLADLNAVEIQLWLNNLYRHPGKSVTCLSARSVNIVRNVFRNMMGFALDNGFISQNPLIRVKHIREERQPPVALTEKQLAKLLKVAKEADYYPGNDAFAYYLRREAYVAVVLAARTGMRRGEVFGLDWDTVHLKQHLLTIRYTLLADRTRASPKTKSSERNILLDDDTVRILSQWKAYQTAYAAHYSGIYANLHRLVFTTGRGTPISMDNFRQRHWNAMCKAAGIPGFGFHGLRHTHATLLLKAGVNVKVVAERLGHADVAITMRTYAHVLPTMQASAVEAIARLTQGGDFDGIAKPSGDAGTSPDDKGDDNFVH